MVREEVLASAVRFLQDPKVQASPLARRIAFLESKGLTAEEIEQAMQRASGGTGTTAGATGTTAVVPTGQMPMQPVPGAPVYQQGGYYGMPMQPPPPPPKERDWKDYFIATTVAFGIGWGIYQFAKVLGRERGRRSPDCVADRPCRSTAELPRSLDPVPRPTAFGRGSETHGRTAFDGVDGIDGRQGGDDVGDEGH